MVGKEEVLGKVLEALILLESSSEFSKLMPEVRVNLVYTSPDAKDPNEVVGIDGRITVVNGLPKAAGLPKFGGSDHMARAMLEIRKYQPEIRAGINFKYNDEIAEVVRRYATNNSIPFGYIDRTKEPSESKTGDVKSMPWKIRSLKEVYGLIPTIFYESAGWGKEPLFVIIGEDPVTVTEMAIEIAQKYNYELKKSTLL